MHPQITSVLNWANPYSPKPNDIVANNAEKVLNYIEDINLEHEVLFRPTLAGIYRLMVTAESPPLESRSELVSLPVITHEQNAVWHLKNTLQTAFSAEKARPPLTENLEQYKALLRAAYARLEAGEETDAIEQLEVFRKRLLTFHRGQSSWAAVIAEVDSLIEGFREADHRFDNWAIETGGGPL